MTIPGFNKIKTNVILALVILMFTLPSGTTNAQTPDNLEFVYGTNHFNGATYSSTMVPPSIDTMYLIANETSMVAARFTEVYYWQITNEYKANWDKANINIDGTLEILKNRSVIQNVSRSEYVIQYDYFDKFGTIKLSLGAEAIAARKDFESKQAQYRDDLHNYYQKLNAYQEEFQAALAKLQHGEITEDQMPQPPIPLKDLSIFSTDLLWGYPINLPPGEYTIRLRLPDGTIQPDSEKHLIVFENLQEGIGYNISAEERWNKPIQSDEESEVVYSLKSKTLYIQPVHQKQYNQLFYSRMNNSQNTTASRDQKIWVPFKEAKEYTLKVSCKNQTTQIQMQDYFVKQQAGSKLGYDIIPFDPGNMDKATFTAFKYSNTEDADVCCWVCLDSHGNEVPKSQREFRILRTERNQSIYLISAFPIIIGLGAAFLRKRQVRKIKVSDGG